MKVRVCSTDELKPEQSTRIDVDGTPVAVFNIAGNFYAIEDTCTHEEASLSEGFVEDDEVECPKHGAVFHVPTGEVKALPATKPVATFATVIEGDDLFVEATDG